MLRLVGKLDSVVDAIEVSPTGPSQLTHMQIQPGSAVKLMLPRGHTVVIVMNK